MRNLIKTVIFTVIAIFAVANLSSLKGVAYESATYVKASHILVDTRQEADSLKTRIDNGESFEALAKKYSKCPSGQEGGDLGYFERGQMVRPFEEAAFSLPVGKVSDPVKTQFGWHLIKVCDKR